LAVVLTGTDLAVVLTGTDLAVVLTGTELVVVDGTELVVVDGTELVVVLDGDELAMKLLVIVAVQVTVLAPVGPEALHWLIVVGSPVLCEGGAVTVQVRVPPAPPEPLHWVTLWPPGPAVPDRLLPGGVATHVSVLTPPGLWHWLTVEAIEAPIG
jgi:hypothetical protein